MGVSSTATVLNGIVYVGGGDAYWYALDATTGAVLWKVYTGDNSATGGHYNWSSPLLYNGYAYIGVASVGDCPLVQGQLLQVNLSTQQVVNTLNIVPNGQTGGGIWTSPTVDPATNTIFVTTGTISDPAQSLAQAMIAIDASTLTITSSWQIPQQETVLDSDWGTSPVLSTDASGRQLVSAINKNGYLYTFTRANVGAGPVWQQHLFIGGECPTCGDGSASNLAFGNGLLYAGGGNAVIAGIGYPGVVTALNPATGAIVWQHPEADPVIPALTYNNGLIVAGSGASLEVLDASTGNRLYSYTTGAVLYGPPSVANGTIFFGSGDNNVYALGLPAALPPPPPADPQCPTGWTCQDIGNPQPVGTESVTSSLWTIRAGGVGVSGVSDQFRLISQMISGDSQVTAQISALMGGSGGQAGIMMRQTNTPDSPYYAVLAMPNNILVVNYRSRFGGGTTTLSTINAALPRYVEIQRTGNVFQAASSADGSTYTLISGASATIIMPYAVMEGVAVSSGANGAAGSASVNGAASGAVSTTLTPAPSPSPCPGGWTCADVGNPLLIGNQSVSNGTWTLSGAGNDIQGYADQFHYVWQSMTGDATVSAHITTQTSSNNSAKAGVMLRQNSSAGAAFYGAFVTPSQSILVLNRSIQGLRVFTQATMSGGAPAYLRIARSGSNVSAYSSPDGVNWTYVVGSSTIMNMSGTALGGLAITSANGGVSSSATMDTVALSNTATPPPVACPINWSCADIGTPVLAGNESLINGVWSIQGAGNDIWGTSDQFHYDWQPLAGDGTLSGHVLTQQNTDNWAKAGLMLRASTDPGSPFFAVYATPGNGITVQYRSTIGAPAQQVANIPGGPPIYLRIGRSGATFIAYTSSDGVIWGAIAGSTTVISSMTGSLLAGVTVTSHNGGALSAATFDTVAFASCPAGWSCADIGNPALLGSQSASNGVWTAQGAGNDIWGVSDQFHYIWQTVSTDGALSTHVASQQKTDPWAKAGVMFRASTNANAAFYDAMVTPNNGISIQYRAAAGSSAQQIIAASGTAPAWLKIAHSGTSFSAYTSSDGVTWALAPNSTITLSNLTGTLLAGVAVTSHNGGALSAVTFDTVTFSTCPSGWTCADIGNPALAGSQTVSNGVWAVQGAGNDIWGVSDQFHYDWQPLASDGTLSAHVIAQQNTDPWAKAGVMLRASADPASAYYAIFTTPGNGIVVQYRTGQGISARQVAPISGTVPAWLKITRAGVIFTAYTSTDGVTWMAIDGSTLSLSNLSGTLLAGVAVTSHNGGALSAVTFDTVTFSTCPSGWTCADIGNPALAGSQTVSNGVWAVQGAGNDIWGVSDQFHYDWQPLASDGTLSAHVIAQQNTDPWAKAGVMLRASADPASAYYAIFTTPGNGIVVQYRTGQGVQTSQIAISGGVPSYVRVSRSGSIFTAYTSTDGVAWKPVPGSSVALTNLSGVLLAGVAVTSHNGGALSAVTFQSVTVA
jgi:outer membrane protein assembly factor BamB